MNRVKRGFAVLSALVLVLTAGCGKKNSTKVVDYTVDVPAGFEEQEEEGFANYWQYSDGSCINVNITDKDSAFGEITADTVRDALVLLFEATYSGVTATVTDKYFTNNEVCGLPAYQYCYTIELVGVKMTQLVVCIDADQTYTITYTDTSGDWISQFETSAKNIDLVFG